MIEQLRFYFRHSFNDLRVNGRRTAFALLCIAAGVAAIVSLQTVAVMIGDTLTTNLQKTNRGDIQISIDMGFRGSQSESLQTAAEDGLLVAQAEGGFGGNITFYNFSDTGAEAMRAWLTEYAPGSQMTTRRDLTNFFGVFSGSGRGTALNAPASGAEASQVTPVLIDPAHYPFYGAITSTDGLPLAEMLQVPTDIVLDQRIAKSLNVTIGDTVRVNGAQADFTVRGIVATESEVADPFQDVFAALFGFYYLSDSAAPLFEGDAPISRIYVQLSDPAQVSAVSARFVQAFPFVSSTTTDDLRTQNAELAEQINQMVTVMGLVSLLLGSIGIINTMQVIVRRRTVEIAVLKAMGLQADQVTILFLVEAFLMGIAGSLLGIVLGWLTTFVIKGVAENLVAQSLSFRIVPAAALNGLIVGTLVTTIFGFLPTLAAGQVRPGVVLRPNDTLIPRAGCLRTLVALVVMVVALALVAQTILGSFGTALGVTLGAFFAAGFLFVLLSFVIWLIGRFFPSLGSVDLKISLRQMLASRGRAAITLLALVVGVFSLSLITLFADSINNLLRFTLAEGSGGNVIVTVAAPPLLIPVEAALKNLDGVNHYQTLRNFNGTLVSIQTPDGQTRTRDEIKSDLLENNGLASALSSFGAEVNTDTIVESQLRTIGVLTGRQMDQLPEATLLRGRAFTSADTGQPVMLMADNAGTSGIGLDVGTRVTYRFGEGADAPTQTFEIVGVTSRSLVSIGANSNFSIPYDALPASVQPASTQILVDIEESAIPTLRQQIGQLPGTFVLETALFTRLLTGLLGTFTAFPTMVALLGLIVGGVVIANSVALSTLERRREIAVMKAIGLQRERVMGMLLLENGILGLIGGLIGVGIGLFGLTVMLAASQGAVQIIPYGTALLLMGLCILVALVAAGATAWGASGEKPLNVLRGE
jgi:putative ABC transport system permease protein